MLLAESLAEQSSRDAARKKILALREQGLSWRDLADRLDISVTTARNWAGLRDRPVRAGADQSRLYDRSHMPTQAEAEAATFVHLVRTKRATIAECEELIGVTEGERALLLAFAEQTPSARRMIADVLSLRDSVLVQFRKLCR